MNYFLSVAALVALIVVILIWRWRRRLVVPVVVPEMPTTIDVRIRTDTVDALLETVRDLLRAEDSRAASLTSRGTSVAGFVGILVSVATGFARTLASDVPRLSGWERDWALRALIGGLVLLSIAGVVAVLGVVLPASGWGIATEEVQAYDQPDFVFAAVVLVKGRVLRGLIDTLASERSRNERKATALKSALIALVLGVLCLAVEAAIIGRATFH